jgi:ABC-type amino acid transport substrate-binding protein
MSKNAFIPSQLIQTLAIAAALAIGFVSLQAAPRRVVKVGAFPHAPAISMGAEGKAQGFYVDMLQEVAAKENWDLRFVPGTWQEGLEQVRSGQVDLLTSVAYSPERHTFLDYGAESSYTVWSILYTHPNSGIRTVLDVLNRRVGLMLGDANGDHFRDLCARFNLPVTYETFGNFEEVMRAVESGRVDAGVVTNIYGYAHESHFRVERTPVVFSPFDIYFAAGQGRNLDVLRALDSYLV